VSDADDDEEQQQEEPEQSVHDMFMEEVHAKETELNKHCLIMGQVRSWQPAVPSQRYRSSWLVS
jgi:hypothetical protein